MPEKSQKRKFRRDPVEDSDLVESSSNPTDENNCISEQDFEEITSKVENKMSKRLRETEHCQKEILKLIENVSAEVDNLTNSSSLDPGCSSSGTETRENLQNTLIHEYVDITEHRNMNSNKVTGVITEPTPNKNSHTRSSSLPPPNQRHSDEKLDKLLESLYATNKQHTGVPRLPKALATTMPTFDGKTEKFEHFEDLFQTKLKVHPQMTEQEKIHYFHSLMRGDAMQTFRNMTEATKSYLNDIIAGFHRRYVKAQSVATARCKWENLNFDPTSQTFQDFLEMYQKLAQEAYAEDAPKFIETSFYAKMPAHLKRVLNQARLETASYETMVQHLEREMELNGLANPDSTPFTGIHIVEPAANTNQERITKITGPCFG